MPERGTLDNPILVNGLFKGEDDKIYQLVGANVTGGSGGSGGGDKPTPPAGSVTTPTITIAGGATNVDLNPTLNGSAFAATETDTHEASEWQVTKGGVVVWSTTNTATTATVDNVTLDPSTTYTAQVRYQGANYGWSAWGSTTFTTKVADTVTTPTLTITGAPNDVPQYPTLTGGAFSASATDTHVGSEFAIETAGARSVVWSKTFTTAVTSTTVDTDVLEPNTAYVAKVRYKGQNLGWSQWASVSFTTAEKFVAEGDVGSIADGTFGVGIAPREVYESLGLSELPGTNDPTSFQYGLYKIEKKINGTETGDAKDRYLTAYVKFIPKFYYAFLTDANGNLLSDTALTELAHYSGISVALLKQAQSRSPNNAFVIAPASAFADEGDAISHNFILPRAFIDGGVVKSGFFIANSLGWYKYQFDNNTGRYRSDWYLGMESEVEPTHDSSVDIGLLRLDNVEHGGFKDLKSFADGVTLCRKLTGFNLATIYMWSAISMLSFAANLYCKDASECAWFQKTGDSSPRGINSSSKDNVDSAVVTTTTITSTTGTPFVSKSQYAKTTHNGTISGITNVNGWLWQPLLGTTGNYDKWMPESASLANITTAGSECTLSYNPTTSAWGTASKQSFFRATNGNERMACGVVPASLTGKSSQSESNLFGNDSFGRYSGTAVPLVGGAWGSGGRAGVFYRSGDSAWSVAGGHCGVRLAGYPKV